MHSQLKKYVKNLSEWLQRNTSGQVGGQLVYPHRYGREGEDTLGLPAANGHGEVSEALRRVPLYFPGTRIHLLAIGEVRAWLANAVWKSKAQGHRLPLHSAEAQRWGGGKPLRE